MVKLFIKSLLSVILLTGSLYSFSNLQDFSSSPTKQGKLLLKKLDRGETITTSEAPWIGRIESYYGGRSYACTGVLVSENLVLTAGHCKKVLKKPIFKWQQAGHFISEQRSAKLHFAPKTSNLWKDDWVIYKLDKKIKFNFFLKIIPSKSVDLKKRPLISMGYTNNDYLIKETYKCKYIGKGLFNKSTFVTDCYSTRGMSGGPILYTDESGELFLVGIRSGTQKGPFVKKGAKEVRSESFLSYIKTNSN